MDCTHSLLSTEMPPIWKAYSFPEFFSQELKTIKQAGDGCFKSAKLFCMKSSLFLGIIITGSQNIVAFMAAHEESFWATE
jgi:hypothetical protein